MGISRKEALECFQSNDLIGVGMEADAVRHRLHPEGVVSYAIECTIDCAALTSNAKLGSKAGENALSGICDAIRETVEQGSTGVRLVNCLRSVSKPRDIECFEEILRGVRQRFPSLWLEGLSSDVIVALAAGCGLELRQIIARLHEAGLNSIASDDRQPKCNVAEWIAVHRAAHGLGMPTVATMAFGAGETSEQRVDLLTAIRQLQEETRGFAVFIPVAAEAASGRELDAVTAVEQLKTLAIARIFLDNIENIQWSGAAQGLKVLQTGLRFGANDAGSVTSQANATNRTTEEDLRHIIRDAGFQPVQRDTSYRTMFMN
jgi:cyclic dehypoxanthinyl futalosine synthase